MNKYIKMERKTAMKRNSQIILFTFIILILIVIVIVSIFTNNNNNDMSETTIKSKIYKVMEYDGKIGIFENDKTIPFEIYNTYTESLPKHDKELLEKGIIAKSEQELQAIIEDYVR